MTAATSACEAVPPRVAVVTGAGRGIGRAVALRLAADGATVVAAARTGLDLESLAASAPTITPVVADVGTEAGVASLREAAERLGALRVWVNNAGILEPAPLEGLDIAGFDRTLAVNLRGALLGCLAAMRLMRAHGGGGVIINIGSLSGILGVEKFPGLAAYNISKAGLAALSESVALEGRQHGIRSVTLAPGAVDTEMLRRANPALRATVGPEGVAELVAFLASEGAAPLSGSTIPMYTNG